MWDKAALTRLRREYANIQNEQIPHVVARPLETNMLEWHYVLHDLPPETPYSGGVYWGKLKFPKEYPLKPPAIYMFTPSGRFHTNTRLCLSMSDFHPETWNPSWRIESILIGLVSFMLDPNEPVSAGGIRDSSANRKKFSRSSFDYNRGRPEFRDLFPEFCDEAKRLPSGRWYLNGPPAAAEATADAESGDAAAAPAGAAGAPRPGGALGGGWLGGRALLALSVLVAVVAGLGLRGAGGR